MRCFRCFRPSNRDLDLDDSNPPVLSVAPDGRIQLAVPSPLPPGTGSANTARSSPSPPPPPPQPSAAGASPPPPPSSGTAHLARSSPIQAPQPSADGGSSSSPPPPPPPSIGSTAHLARSSPPQPSADRARSSSPPPSPPSSSPSFASRLTFGSSNSSTESARRSPNETIIALNYSQLDRATNHFSVDNILGQGGFGTVFKGQLRGSRQEIAVKKLNTEGLQGDEEFVVEVLMLSRLIHPNIIRLIGYCIEGKERLIVYEYMPFGSLQDLLIDLGPGDVCLTWNVRMSIASDTAKALQYLHNEARPRIIYRDVKCANIICEEGFRAKLSDFGIARMGPTSGRTPYLKTRIMGTFGYCDPEYAETGHLTFKSDIYSFGVVLLELLSGRRVLDPTQPHTRTDLVEWVRRLSREPRRYVEIADPRLRGAYPRSGMREAVTLAVDCVAAQADQRPDIAAVVRALEILESRLFDPDSPDSESSGEAALVLAETSAAAEARGTGRRRSVPAIPGELVGGGGDLRRRRGWTV